MFEEVYIVVCRYYIGVGRCRTSSSVVVNTHMSDR